MASNILVMLFALVSLWTIADAKSHETLILKIFNPDDRPSDDQILATLKKADLESHGYKKEVTTKLVSDPVNDKPLYEKAYFYYKIVHCSRLQEIVQELQTLIPDHYGVEMVTKINGEIKAKNLSNMKQCKVGFEVHFKDGVSCADKKSTTRRTKRGTRYCWWCHSCGRIEASD